MISLTINGKKTTAAAGTTILEVARELGLPVPTLCYHEALLPSGACRLCIVEVRQNSLSKTMASCVTPVQEGMVVLTHSGKIVSIRRTIMELLLARCPNIPVIREMAREMGIRRPRFQTDDEECFLCGLCVRACEEIVGVAAIGFSARGTGSAVSSPFREAATVCIGCGTCMTICPARTFKLEEVNPVTSRHRFADAPRESCRICGSSYPAEQGHSPEQKG